MAAEEASKIAREVREERERKASQDPVVATLLEDHLDRIREAAGEGLNQTRGYTMSPVGRVTKEQYEAAYQELREDGYNVDTSGGWGHDATISWPE